MTESNRCVPQQRLRELAGARCRNDKALPILPVLYRDHLEEALVLRVPRGDVVGLVHHNKLSQSLDPPEPPRLLEQLLEENLAEEVLRRLILETREVHHEEHRREEVLHREPLLRLVKHSPEVPDAERMQP